MRALGWVHGYERSWLRFDVIGGLTITALLVPEGMAYAELAGMPPQTAFYAAPIGLGMYALLGTSRQLVVAVSSAIAVLSAATVAAIAPTGTSQYVALTAALALLAGLISIGAGVLHLGRLVQFFSDSVLTGFVSGLALLITIKQLPKILGIEVHSTGSFLILRDVALNINDAHLRTLAVGIATLVVMLAVERFAARLPAALIALVFGISVSAVLDLAAKGVKVVGTLPSGLAAPAIPDVSASDVLLLVGGALGIALVSFAEAIGPARVFASEHRYDIDVNQELIALGAANAGAGLFQGFPIGSSLSKSAANDEAGARTPLALLVAAALTALVALFLTGLFTDLPEACLGAIVVIAVARMIKIPALRRLYRIHKVDFALAMTAQLGVLLFGAIRGLGLAVALSFLVVVTQSASGKITIVGREPGREDFVDISRHPLAVHVPGVLVLRLDEPLFFANARSVGDRVVALAFATDPPIHTIVLDLEATSAIDVAAVDELSSVASRLRDRGITLRLARVRHDVHSLIDRAGASSVIPPDHIHHRIANAVNASAPTGSDPAP